MDVYSFDVSFILILIDDRCGQLKTDGLQEGDPLRRFRL
jgi:hypothetical protein